MVSKLTGWCGSWCGLQGARRRALGALALLCCVLVAGEPVSELVSGRATGERVPQFFVRAVTGPLMNKSVCYVCRNGDRPVVMVFFRDVIEGVPKLLKELDTYIDQQRAVGLRGFAVLLSENQRNAVSQLQTLSFDHQLSLPLAVASTQLDAPSSQNLHPDAAVTVVLYHDQTVVKSHAFRASEINDDRIAEMMSSVKALAAKGH